MLYIILSPHDRRQISQSSSSSSFTTMFARSKTKRSTKHKPPLSHSLARVCFPPFFDDRDKTADRIYVCVLSLGVFPLLRAFKMSAKCFFFLSVVVVCGWSKIRV
jgi:hypothetical protein